MFGLFFDLAFMVAALGFLTTIGSNQGLCDMAGIPESGCQAAALVALIGIPLARGVARAHRGVLGHVIRLVLAFGMPALGAFNAGIGALVTVTAVLIILYAVTAMLRAREPGSRHGTIWSSWGAVGVITLLTDQAFQAHLSPAAAVAFLVLLLWFHHFGSAQPDWHALTRVAMGVGVAAAGLILGAVGLHIQAGVPLTEVVHLLVTTFALQMVIYVSTIAATPRSRLS